jgi:bifunctional UDP-N-acetylglucosamine pyrophosphorylase/glucosamine-1-phosphate N-acetyltransferase
MGMEIIILAAGQGTRMRSALPKVLHPLGGAPLLQHVIATARALRADAIHVVYGHGGEQVRATLADAPVQWVEQAQQLGTGHAVAQALPAIADGQTVLILYGDVPLIGADTLGALAEPATRGDLGLLTAILDNPFGYGRILRDDTGRVTGIVEEKDASETQREIRDVNTGFMAANAGRLKAWVAKLGTGNAQGEYYLTDVIGQAAAANVPIHTLQPASLYEVLGVNDRVQLAALERHYQFQKAEALMRAGVTLRDPSRIDVRGTLTMGRDGMLDVNLVFEGEVSIGERVCIGPNCVIRDSRIGDDVVIHANCVIEEADIGAASRIGPFARLRPETRLAEQVHVGNFVEIKKSEVAQCSKINHLSYVGDTSIGSRVNIGAGTITCNYDGANKHRTIIGDDVFIGSDTQLVAPVSVGDGATIGAGSTITRDVPPNELTLSRSKQETRKGWKRPVKKKGK